MDEVRLDDLSIDAMWQMFFLQANYYNKKATLINYLYGEIVKQFNIPEETLSLKAKTILLENNLIKPMGACKSASLKCITDSTVAVSHSVDGFQLNERGFARLSVLSNINSNTSYSHRGNKNIYLALANALKNFSLRGTQFTGKGMFEVVANYVYKHPVLHTATPKSIANSLFTQIEMQDLVTKLNQSFDLYLDSLLSMFKSELRQQRSDTKSINVIDDIAKEVEQNFNMFSTNYNTIISSNIPAKILAKYENK